MKMLVGLTGKTGSGKSSAAKTFEKLGAFVVDCDKTAHAALQDDTVKEKLKKEFSSAIFDESGDVNRKKLGAIVFSDIQKLSKLNAIVHPAVIEKSLEMCIESGKDICILDGSELEASGIDKNCAHVIVITADEDIRLDRIMKRDGIDRESALMRIRAQKDYQKDAIILTNDGNPDMLEKEISALYNKFCGELNVENGN